MFCAGALVVPDAPAPRVAVPDAPAEEPEPEPVPEPLPPVVPEPEPLPVPLPPAWPGLRFSVAFAASAVKADIVFSPDAGLLGGLVWCVMDGGRGDLRVDGAHHPALAVLCLRAVEPDGLAVRDADGVGEQRGVARRGGGGHEAREEGVGLVGHDVLDGHAGVVEGGLDHGVVLGIVSQEWWVGGEWIFSRRRTLGWNWNCTMSPALALMLLGKKAMEPFGPPTWMVCVTRLPVEPVAADVDPDAVDVEFVVEVLVSEAAMDADDTED